MFPQISRNCFLHFVFPFALRFFIALYFAFYLLSICRQWTPEIGDREVYLGRRSVGGRNGKFGGKTEEENDRRKKEEECDRRVMNSRRVEVAEQMLMDWVGKRKSGIETKKSEEWLMLGIVASARPNRELIQLIGHLVGFWQRDPADHNDLPSMFICNTELKGRRFGDIEEILRSLGSNLVRIFDLNKNISDQPNPTKKDARIAKEAEDYWKCIQKIAEAGNGSAEYLLILEDDVVPIPAFRQALSYLRARMNSQTDVDFVKLYHPWVFRGIPWIIQSFVLSFLYAFLASKLSNLWRKQSPLESLLFNTLITVGMHYLIKRHFFQLFSDLRFAFLGGPNLTLPESCCTQAVLIRASSAYRMSKTLAMEKSFDGHAKDHILDESPFVGRQTDTNLVVHIGWFSVLRGKSVPTGEMICRT